MNDVEFKGDLYYVDKRGDSWKITQRPGERNPAQRYWHADKMYGESAHKVSASAYRLLIGIDANLTGESEHDGATTQDDTENGSESHTEPHTVGPAENHGIETVNAKDYGIENRRQAYLA